MKIELSILSVIAAATLTFAGEPGHDDVGPAPPEIVLQRRPERTGALGVVGPVEHDQGLAPDDLEAAGHLHRIERVSDDVAVEGATEERLGGRHGTRRVVPLVRAAERHEQVVEDP